MEASGEKQFLNFLAELIFDEGIFVFLSESMCILTDLRLNFSFLRGMGDRLRTDVGKLRKDCGLIGGSFGFLVIIEILAVDIDGFTISRALI